MSTTQVLIVVVLVVLVAVAAAAALAARRRKRTEQLRGTFGDEYDRTVDGAGGRRDAERDLADRKDRHDKLEIRPLSPASRERYVADWQGVQGRFVDSPVRALSEADDLLTRMLAERGFPSDDVRTQEEMLSVEHAHVLDGFRAGHAIEQANAGQDASTEQVRQGMLHFRQVFDDLVDDGPSRETAPRQDRPAPH